MDFGVSRLVHANRGLITCDHGKRRDAWIQQMAPNLAKVNWRKQGRTADELIKRISKYLDQTTTELETLDQIGYNFDSDFVASTRLFLPPKPNR